MGKFQFRIMARREKEGKFKEYSQISLEEEAKE
jgi:hypothetical protein